MSVKLSGFTPGPWVVGTMGHDTDMDTQIACLKEGENTEREWTAIGFEDADGFAEVVALAHPSNAALIAQAPTLLEQRDKLVKALRLYRASHNVCIEGEPQGLCNKCQIAERVLREVGE